MEGRKINAKSDKDLLPVCVLSIFLCNVMLLLHVKYERFVSEVRMKVSFLKVIVHFR